MYFKKYLLSFVLVVFVFCPCHCESGVNKFFEDNILEFDVADMGSFLLKNSDDPMLILHNDTEWSADEKECECKNGRCETTCGEWKDGVCRRTTQVCVCDPEFGKYDDHTCIYCDCGNGFNCTIDRESRGDVRKCICPEGYYDYAGKCAPFCSEIHPCLNGGTCQDGRCRCMSSTFGPFCRGIFWCAYECRPRLIVDCIYNQSTENYGCQCKNRSLVFDYKEMVCKPCPCGEGTCREERHELRCDCKAGYKEFDRQCKKCDCGPDQECELHWRTGEKICKCQRGYFEREGKCLPCFCGNEEATCSLDDDGRKKCICPKGFEDKLGMCVESIHVANCTCHPTTVCMETDNGFYCACKDGYTTEDYSHPEPGEPCQDVDECQDSQRCPRWKNQKCVNFPGSYMCQCTTGYVPVISIIANDGRITCEKYKVSWLPTGITIGVLVAIIAISVGFIWFLKRRDSSRNVPGMEMRGTR